jgi:predicted  nucleic acid-binding Zn-ribbon protein
MPNNTARIDRLEDSMNRAFNAIEALAEKQARLDDVITLLTEAQIETTKSLRTLGQETDARIQSLTSAIGELIRRIPAQ